MRLVHHHWNVRPSNSKKMYREAFSIGKISLSIRPFRKGDELLSPTVTKGGETEGTREGILKSSPFVTVFSEKRREKQTAFVARVDPRNDTHEGNEPCKGTTNHVRWTSTRFQERKRAGKKVDQQQETTG